MKSRLMMIALLSLVLAHGQAAPELLQKAIYTQETLGNLDEAIALYRRVIAAGKDSRAYAAQAQLRLGLCLKQKGQAAEGDKLLRELIEEFPDQKEAVAKARQALPGLQLDAVPWPETGEILVHAVRANKMTVGPMAMAFDPAGARAWRFLTRVDTDGGNVQYSYAMVSRDTFRPSSSLMRHMMIGELKADYQANKVSVSINGKPSGSAEIGDTVIDNEMGIATIRRLPLSVGASFELPWRAGGGSTLHKFPAKVVAREIIEVPMGKFDTYRVEMTMSPVMQYKFWVAADAKRYMVRTEAMGQVTELATVQPIQRGAAIPYQHPQGAFSFQIPGDWYVGPHEGSAGNPAAIIADLDGQFTSIVRGETIAADQVGEDAVRAAMAKAAEDGGRALKNFQIRANGWRTRTIAGRLAVSQVADFETEQGVKMAMWRVWLQKGTSRITFRTRVEAKDLAAIEAKFEPVLNSLGGR